MTECPAFLPALPPSHCHANPHPQQSHETQPDSPNSKFIFQWLLHDSQTPLYCIPIRIETSKTLLFPLHIPRSNYWAQFRGPSIQLPHALPSIPFRGSINGWMYIIRCAHGLSHDRGYASSPYASPSSRATHHWGADKRRRQNPPQLPKLSLGSRQPTPITPRGRTIAVRLLLPSCRYAKRRKK